MIDVKFIPRIALIAVIAQITVGCAPVVDRQVHHYPGTSCSSSCSGQFPHTGGHGSHP